MLHLTPPARDPMFKGEDDIYSVLCLRADLIAGAPNLWIWGSSHTIKSSWTKLQRVQKSKAKQSPRADLIGNASALSQSADLAGLWR